MINTCSAATSDPQETLVRVLTYHVVPSVAAKAEDLSDGQELPTALEGQSLKVHGGWAARLQRGGRRGWQHVSRTSASLPGGTSPTRRLGRLALSSPCTSFSARLSAEAGAVHRPTSARLAPPPYTKSRPPPPPGWSPPQVKLDRRHVFLRTTSEQEVKVIEADLEAGRSIIHVVEQVGGCWSGGSHREGCVFCVVGGWVGVGWGGEARRCTVPEGLAHLRGVPTPRLLHSMLAALLIAAGAAAR
jgi:hypothetical protein